MKVNEILIEQKLNEHLDPDLARQIVGGLTGIGIGSVIVILANLALSPIIATGGDFKDSNIARAWRKVKDALMSRQFEKAGKAMSEEELKAFLDQLKSKLTKGQQTYVTSLERKMRVALKNEDFKSVGKLFKMMQEYDKRADADAAYYKRSDIARRKENVNEATPFRKVGKHKGYMMRTLSPAEQAAGERAVKAASKPKPPKPSKEEKQKAMDDKLWKIYIIVNDAVGNSVPDGDPIDYVFPRVSKFLGIEKYDVRPWLDKAMKSQGYKNYDDYLVSMWDAYYEATAENAEEYAQMKKENPWR